MEDKKQNKEATHHENAASKIEREKKEDRQRIKEMKKRDRRGGWMETAECTKGPRRQTETASN